MVSKIGEYKGNKIIQLIRDEDDKFGFSFGIVKAKLILDNLEDIKAFVEDNNEAV